MTVKILEGLSSTISEIFKDTMNTIDEFNQKASTFSDMLEN
ncbi:hypothetical protein [Borreliella valaisiana]